MGKAKLNRKGVLRIPGRLIKLGGKKLRGGEWNAVRKDFKVNNEKILLE